MWLPLSAASCTNFLCRSASCSLMRFLISSTIKEKHPLVYLVRFGKPLSTPQKIKMLAKSSVFLMRLANAKIKEGLSLLKSYASYLALRGTLIWSFSSQVGPIVEFAKISSLWWFIWVGKATLRWKRFPERLTFSSEPKSRILEHDSGLHIKSRTFYYNSLCVFLKEHIYGYILRLT